ncbi:hypothetical protein L21SP5_01725 [Salinivirga cyanobacteriivorans]|uniref:Membrane or secreted protein n=1 Tax=Salinivirga cyanobacteriivorans TaxID=1307839 RepID=A0A0S2HZ43_9BACT|nr:hypothetical protein [Salinivirga cyanobacteriivorans]ALO15367.1 hypothetical protein L21SP5_01725 [Salinivirga cyanobacteriivorans]
MKKKNLLFTLGLACIVAFGAAFFSIQGNAKDNGGAGHSLSGTVRKPKAVLCSKCGETHYNTECEGTGDGCDPTSCPY